MNTSQDKGDASCVDCSRLAALQVSLAEVDEKNTSSSDREILALRVLAEQMGCWSCVLWTVSQPGGAPAFAAAWPAQEKNSDGPPETPNAVNEAVRLGVPQQIASPDGDPDAYRGKPTVVFPAFSGGAVLGVVELKWAVESAAWRPGSLMLKALGAYFGQWLRAARLAAALADARSLAAALVESAPDAIIVMDQRGQVVEFNPAAERLFGYTRADVLDKDLAELIMLPALRGRHRSGIVRYISGGKGNVVGNEVELTAVRSDGSRFRMQLAVSQTHSSAGPLFVGHMRQVERSDPA